MKFIEYINNIGFKNIDISQDTLSNTIIVNVIYNNGSQENFLIGKNSRYFKIEEAHLLIQLDGLKILTNFTININCETTNILNDEFSEKINIFIKNGIILFENNKCTEAFNAFRQILSFAPLNYAATYYCGLISTYLENHPLSYDSIHQAKQYYHQLLEINPNCVYANYLLAKIHFKKSEFEKSTLNYSIFLKKFPTNINVLIERGMAYSKQKQHLNAKLDFDNAIDAGYKNFFERGQTNLHLNNFESALNDFTEALKDTFNNNTNIINENILQARLGLAVKYFKSRNYNMAFWEFEKYLKIKNITSEILAEIYLITKLKKNNVLVNLTSTNEYYIELSNLQKKYYKKYNNNAWINFKINNNLSLEVINTWEDITEYEVNAKKLIEYKKNYKIGFGKNNERKIIDLISEDPEDIISCIINLKHFAISNLLLLSEDLIKCKNYLYAVEINIIKLKLIKFRKNEFEEELKGIIVNHDCIYNNLQDSKFVRYDNDLIIVKKENKFGVINKQGDFIVPIVYEYISYFIEGLAIVQLEFKEDFNGHIIRYFEHGFIDLNGKVVIPIEYSQAEPFKDGVSLVSIWGEYPGEDYHSYFLIDKNNKRLTSYSESSINFIGNYAKMNSNKEFSSSHEFYLGGKYGLINRKYKNVIDSIFDSLEVYEISENTIIVAFLKNKGYCMFLLNDNNFEGTLDVLIFIDNDTNNLLPLKLDYIGFNIEEYFVYQYIGEFKENNAIIFKNKKYSFVNSNLKVISGFIYDLVNDFKNGMAAVCINNKWGFIDKAGNLVISIEFDEVQNFSCGKASVKKNDKWGFINLLGEECSLFEFERVDQLYGGITKVYNNNKWSYLNIFGEQCIPAEYDEISNYTEGLASVKKNAKYGFLNLEGKLIIQYNYEAVGYFKNGKANVCKNGKWGFINLSEEIIVPFIYEKLNQYCEEKVAAKNDGKWGFLDELGNELIPFIYDSVGYFKNGKTTVENYFITQTIDEFGNLSE